MQAELKHDMKLCSPVSEVSAEAPHERTHRD